MASITACYAAGSNVISGGQLCASSFIMFSYLILYSLGYCQFLRSYNPVHTVYMNVMFLHSSFYLCYLCENKRWWNVDILWTCIRSENPLRPWIETTWSILITCNSPSSATMPNLVDIIGHTVCAYSAPPTKNCTTGNPAFKGHSRLSEMTRFDLDIEIHSIYDRFILYRLRDMRRYWSKGVNFSLPHLYLTPLLKVLPS